MQIQCSLRPPVSRLPQVQPPQARPLQARPVQARFPQVRLPQARLPEANRSHTSPLDLVGQMELMGAPMSFSRNAEIYGENEPADYLYKVVSGSVRTYKIFDDGRRQIGEFYFPGDMFGLEVGETHQFSAEAIENCVILLIKRSALVALAEHNGDIARELWTFTARELQQVRAHMMLLIKNAEERVACFLLEMADRLSTAESVELPMSRQDIADYLGLTIETVSRTLTHLEAKAVIALPTSRRIVLRNRKALIRLDA
jgi:CRP/FNR family transcriptional regulator, nitrogen fixation regulation protein